MRRGSSLSGHPCSSSCPGSSRIVRRSGYRRLAALGFGEQSGTLRLLVCHAERQTGSSLKPAFAAPRREHVDMYRTTDFQDL
jgi:hypothetical protein